MIIKSTCIYCGIGCKLKYEVKNNKIIRVLGDEGDEVSKGMPCIKGLTIHESYNKNKISNAYINGEKTTIRKAIKEAARIIRETAPNELFFNTSGRITNENNYAIQWLASKLKTSNVDSCCGRLCHNATIMGMNNVYGTPTLTSIDNIKKIDTILIVGSEPEKNYPVIYNQIKKRKIKEIRIHHYHTTKNTIIIKPGTITCLLNGLIRELRVKRYEGASLLKKITSKYTPEYVTKETGISIEEYKQLIKNIKQAKKLGIMHGMGLTQQLNSIENIHSLLNLALTTNALILTMRGEINVQGAGDISSGLCKTCKGLNIIEALVLAPVRTAVITEFNPIRSLPDTELIKQRLKKTNIIYLGNKWNATARKARIVIPIASILGSNGTITNSERRIRIIKKVINEGPELWEVIKKISSELRIKTPFNKSSDLTLMIKKEVSDYNNIRIKKESYADKKIKHKRYMPEEYDGKDTETNNKYPYILTTYRSAYSFLHDNIKSNTLKKLREPPGFYFNPQDMKKEGIKQEQEITIESTTNKLTGKAYKADNLPRGVIGAYIHYDELPINKLFPLRFDEESYTPNYKSVAVRIQKH